MAQTGSDLPPQRNLVTRQKHRRETMWQITVPLVISILFLLTMAVLAGVATPAQASQWADISMIWLIAPTYIVGLITLLILAASIYAIVRLIMVLPIYTFRALNWLNDFGSRVKMLGNKAVAPILRAQSFMASAQELGRILRGKSGSTSSDI